MHVKLLENIKSFGYKPPKDPEKLLYDFYFMVGHMPTTHEDKVVEFVLNEALNDCTVNLQAHMLKALYWALCAEIRHVWSESDLRLSSYRSEKAIADLPEHIRKFLTSYTKALAIYTDEYMDALQPGRKQKTMDTSRSLPPESDKDAGFGNTSSRQEDYGNSFLAVEKARKSLKLSKTETVQIMKYLYGSVKWGHSYGGEAWASIADGYLKLALANNTQSRIVYIDHAYDLQHNNGTVFTKVKAYYKGEQEYSWIKDALDWKRDQTDLRGFYSRVSSTLKPVVAWVAKDKYDITMDAYLDPEALEQANAVSSKKSSRKQEHAVGDVVVVKKDLQPGKKYGGISFVGGMLRMLGKPATIVAIDRSPPTTYTLKGSDFAWTDEMLVSESLLPKKFYINMAHLSREARQALMKKLVADVLPHGSSWHAGSALDAGAVHLDKDVVDLTRQHSGVYKAGKSNVDYIRNLKNAGYQEITADDILAGKYNSSPNAAPSDSDTKSAATTPKTYTYKVGDVVIVRPDLSTRDSYDGVFVTPQMTAFAGKAVTITKASPGSLRGLVRYRIAEDLGKWVWIAEMFSEKAPDETDYKGGSAVNESRDFHEFFKFREAVTMAQVGGKLLANASHFAKNMSQVQDFRISDLPAGISTPEDLLYNLATDKQRGRVLSAETVEQLKNLQAKHGNLKAAISAWIKANPDAGKLLNELLRQGVTASQISKADTGNVRKTGSAAQLQAAARGF